MWRLRMPLEAPPGALSHFLLAGCLWFSTSSLLLWLWLLLAFARPFLPLLPLISYTSCPLPLCVVIAPSFLAFISTPRPDPEAAAVIKGQLVAPGYWKVGEVQLAHFG